MGERVVEALSKNDGVGPPSSQFAESIAQRRVPGAEHGETAKVEPGRKRLMARSKP